MVFLHYCWCSFYFTKLQILRSDIVEDCGLSMNPYVDIGQVEGSVVMGFGLYTSEAVKYNTETGEKLSNSTWVSIILL